MNKLLTFLLLAFIANISLAQGWTGYLTVEGTVTEGSTDTIIIKTSGVEASDIDKQYTTGCLANQWIFTSDTEDRRNRSYSTVMAALVSGKKIRLWYKDTCASWNYHQATSIQILK